MRERERADHRHREGDEESVPSQPASRQCARHEDEGRQGDEVPPAAVRVTAEPEEQQRVCGERYPHDPCHDCADDSCEAVTADARRGRWAAAHRRTRRHSASVARGLGRGPDSACAPRLAGNDRHLSTGDHVEAPAVGQGSGQASRVLDSAVVNYPPLGFPRRTHFRQRGIEVREGARASARPRSFHGSWGRNRPRRGCGWANVAATRVAAACRVGRRRR